MSLRGPDASRGVHGQHTLQLVDLLCGELMRPWRLAPQSQLMGHMPRRTSTGSLGAPHHTDQAMRFYEGAPKPGLTRALGATSYTGGRRALT